MPGYFLCEYEVHQSPCYYIYRPPPSSINGLSVNLFEEEFSSLLEEIVLSPSEFLLLGDFNFRIDDQNDIQAKQFLDLIESCKQLVNQATHIRGHLLDLVLVRSDIDYSFLSDLCVYDQEISDHSAIIASVWIWLDHRVRERKRY